MAHPEPWLERQLRRTLSYRTLLLSMMAWIALTICFGWLVRYYAADGPRFRLAGQVASDIAAVPSTLLAILRGSKPGQAHGIRARRPNGFTPITGSPIPTDFLLVARYSAEMGRYVVHLVRTPDATPLRVYAPDIAGINSRSHITSDLLNISRDRTPDRYRLSHPLLMEDGGIVFQDAGPLVRIDACGRVLWTIDGIFHHSIERDADGNLWVPYTPLRSHRVGVGPGFRDDGLAHVSPDGRLLSVVLLADILKKNGLSYIFESRFYEDDPFHLNDIEPVLESGPYWQRGDVFLSIRHQSLVLLYRPSTGRVIWSQQGPWRLQHDVNILDNRRISIFDNRIAFAKKQQVDGANTLVIRDFMSESVSSPWDAAFAKAGVRTVTQGRGTILPGGDAFVEDTEDGRLLRLSPDGLIRWEYIAADSKGQRLFVAWSRILDPQRNAVGINAAINARCE